MFGFLGRAYHTYKVEFGLTMLSSVEVTISNAFFLLILSVTGYSIYNVTSAVAGFLAA